MGKGKEKPRTYKTGRYASFVPTVGMKLTET